MSTSRDRILSEAVASICLHEHFGDWRDEFDEAIEMYDYLSDCATALADALAANDPDYSLYLYDVGEYFAGSIVSQLPLSESGMKEAAKDAVTFIAASSGT